MDVATKTQYIKILLLISNILQPFVTSYIRYIICYAQNILHNIYDIYHNILCTVHITLQSPHIIFLHLLQSVMDCLIFRSFFGNCICLIFLWIEFRYVGNIHAYNSSFVWIQLLFNVLKNLASPGCSSTRLKYLNQLCLEKLKYDIRKTGGIFFRTTQLEWCPEKIIYCKCLLIRIPWK